MIKELCEDLGEAVVTGFSWLIHTTFVQLIIKFFSIIFAIAVELFFLILDFVGRNLRNLMLILQIGLPYLMWYLGATLYEERGEFAVGGEIFVPLVTFILIYFIGSFANRIGKGERIPVPKKRFTEVEDGEVSIPVSRQDEMLFYLADLEDYFERKGLMSSNKDNKDKEKKSKR
jgi:hypothetical protein